MSRLAIRSSFESEYPGLRLSGGFRKLNALYDREPLATPVRSLRAFAEGLAWPSSYRKPPGRDGEHPRDREMAWVERLQGVTHDADHWYFTQQKQDDDNRIYRADLELDLNMTRADRDSGRWSRGFKSGTMPGWAKRRGYDHFGDCDYFGGRVYVAVEGATPGMILEYDAGTLQSTGHGFVLDGRTVSESQEAPWCAVHPWTGVLYTSRFNLPGGRGLRLYEMERGSGGALTGLRHLGELVLRDERGRPLSLKRIQGGAFSPRGHLYLACDDRHTNTSAHISGFDVLTGWRRAKMQVQARPDGLLGDKDELEGLTIWNLSEPSLARRVPHIRGQVHVPMLDKDLGTDQLYFKHYVADKPELV